MYKKMYYSVYLNQHKKVSQSVTILCHLFHYDFLVNVALIAKQYTEMKKKLLITLRLDGGIVSIQMVHVVEVYSIYIITILLGYSVKYWMIQCLLLLILAKKWPICLCLK